MTFEKFWKEYEESSDLLSLEGVARWAWEEAILAERERCVEEVLYRLRGDQVNFDDSSGDTGQYYAGKVDALDEVLDAIRNP